MNMISQNAEQRYRKVVTNVTPKFFEWQEVEVNLLTDGCLIEEYARVEYAAIQARLQLTGGSVSFTEQEFIKFCMTYVYARVQWVNGKTYLHPREKGLVIPSFLSLILQNIGRAASYDLGIELIPVFPTEVGGLEFKPMDVNEMRKISADLKVISDYEGASELPRDKSGCFEFMSMQLIDDRIRSHTRDHHNVYALMASVMGPSLVRSVLDPLVVYGEQRLFRGLLWELTSV
jgi:hypothetical protein